MVVRILVVMSVVVRMLVVMIVVVRMLVVMRWLLGCWW